MPIQETFEEIPKELTTDSLVVRIPNRDRDALNNMVILYYNMAPQKPTTYAYGSWGYIILRTVYTPESVDLLPSALEKMKRWMSQFHLHYNRFPWVGEKGERAHQKLSNGSINDELARRFRVELVEDKDKLNFPNLSGASHDEIAALCDVFDAWVASVGQDPGAQYSVSPRFCDCLVVDEEALRSLAALPEEPPQLRVAPDWETKMQWRSDSHAFFWLLDTRAVRTFAPVAGQAPVHRAWMKVEVGDMSDAWFDRCNRLELGGEKILHSRERGENTAEYWHCFT